MKVRELKNFLELQTDEARAGQALKSYAHWLAAIFQAREYVIGNTHDRSTLEKLKGLKLVKLNSTTAALTTSGRELYQDFTAHGYYV